MTVHRFYCEKIIQDNAHLRLEGPIAWQISKVLRLKIGDTISVFNGRGEELLISLSEISHDSVIGEIISTIENTAEPNVHISLYQSLLPKEKFEEVLQKGTEAGVSAFYPLLTQRTIIKTKTNVKNTRWNRIIQEAAEQSERSIVPSISEPISFRNAIEESVKGGTVFIAWEHEDEKYLSQVLPSIKEHSNVSLFIGPEGGFTEEEIIFAKGKGVVSISLGPRILRSETAAPILASLILYSTKDLDRKRNTYGV